MKKHKYDPSFIQLLTADSDYFLKILENLSVQRDDSYFLPKQRFGGDYTMKCPFHNDHHPSMRLYAQTKIAKCFVCGKSANVLTFIQLVYNISFIEAVQKALSFKKHPFGYVKPEHLDQLVLIFPIQKNLLDK